jgi:outer membrane protein assembly factor BamB
LNIWHTITSSPRRVFGVLLLAALVLASCGGSRTDSWPGVTIDADTSAIYIANDERVVAVNPNSGATLWKYGYEGAKFYAVPTVVDGVVYVGDYQERLHAIDATNGERLWVYEPDKEKIIGPISLRATDRVIGAVEVGPDYVYVGLGSRNVIAISRETHEEAWKFETKHGVWAKPLYVPADEEMGRDTAVLYVVSLDQNLYALDPATGKKLWEKSMGGAVPGDMTYDVARNWLYVGTFVSEVVAVDLTSRTIVDRFETADWVWGAPAYDVDKDTLYVGDLSGNVYAIRVTDEGFSQVWEKDLSDEAIRSSPLIVGDIIVVGSKDKHVYALNKGDGKKLWDKGVDGEALTNLLFVSQAEGAPAADTSSTAGDNADATAVPTGPIDLVVVGTDKGDNRLVALNIETGDRDWRYGD